MWWNMQTQSPEEQELAVLIVDTLNLEDVDPSDISPEDPLFDEGLGLDSIDALELALAITQKYAIQLRADSEDVQQVFSTLRSLNAFIEANTA